MSDEHVYGLDGIREGNNKFPLWLLIFGISLISWGVYYLFAFWTMPGDEARQIVLNSNITIQNDIIPEGSEGQVAVVQKEESSAGDTDKLLAEGKTVYLANCAGCHGNKGKGDGPAAVALNPKPRNFVKGDYKLGSDKDSIINTVQTGISGTAMPPWKDSLSQDQIEAVVTYVMAFKK